MLFLLKTPHRSGVLFYTKSCYYYGIVIYMESFTSVPREDLYPEITPGLEIVPIREEKPATPISDIEGGLNIVNSIIEKEGDENTREKPPTLH